MSRLASLKAQIQLESHEYPIDGKYNDTSDGLIKVAQSGREDMERERRQANFNVREMTYFIDGGKEETLLREAKSLEFERDPTFRMDDYYDLTRAQVRERVMTRIRSIAYYVETESIEQFILRIIFCVLIDPGFMTRISVHYALFAKTITGQGTPEQVAYWIGKGVMNLKGLIGCFAMTELGHGSNVAGIETTATFDQVNDEFIIHSPTLTSTKWWIGGAAESATHGVVFANLIVNGKRFGVKPFVVPLREPETFTLLPGVNIGDCGAKFGRNAIDNGWIQFTFVRIPRSYMLMKYTKVARDGTVTEPPSAQLAYGALIFGRTSIIKESSEYLKKAITIAIRYGVVRRQGGRVGNREMTIMDYKTHQQKLIPILASDYAMIFTGHAVFKAYTDLMATFETIKSTDPQIHKAVEALKELHATSAGLKAFCTWSTLQSIETCRQSLGGQGYSSYSGVGPLYQDFAVQCTWEGDNSVLTLQTGRYLLACMKAKQKGTRLPKGVDYMNHLPGILTRKFPSGGQVTDLTLLAEGYSVVAANCAVAAAKAYQKLLSSSSSESDALEGCSAQRFVAAKMHCLNFMLVSFKDAIALAPGGLQPILQQLCGLFALHNINENAGAFLQYGYFGPEHIDAIQSQINNLIDELRPQVVPLTDAFNLSDYIINSPLGCHDGDVYRRIFDWVRRTNPIGQPHAYFERVIKPAIFRKDTTAEVIQNIE